MNKTDTCCLYRVKSVKYQAKIIEMHKHDKKTDLADYTNQV